jgi:DNA-binding NarL/FixJ family response regulator
MNASLQHGMTHEEIAKELGITVGAVGMCLTRALRKLRREGLIFTCRELATELDRNRKGLVE